MVDENILIESQSARSGQLAKVDPDRALDILNKAKAMVFALWEGVGRATTEQIAKFYEVDESILRKTLQRKKSEFVLDGLEVAKGKRLKDVSDILSLSSAKAPSLTLWTPRAALRAAFFLTQSEVAKQVRTLVLDIVEQVPQQSEEIEKLKLQLAIANEQRRAFEVQERIMGRSEAIATLHGVETLALIQGRPNAIVHKKETVTETIVCQGGRRVSFKGKSLAECARELGFKSGKQLQRWLESIGESGLIGHGLRAVSAEYIPEENLAELRAIFSHRRGEGDRQMLLGE